MTDSPFTHVALIRGINVGGKNIVPMAGLRAALEGEGFAPVATYIQSGNVLVGASGRSESEVNAAVERVLARAFGVQTIVVTVAAEAVRAVMSGAPAGFGAEPDTYHYDVAFLAPGTSGADALPHFAVREGVDAVWAGQRAVYFRRLSAERTTSKMSAVMASPVYKLMTIRNWRTTTTLVRMLDG